MFELTHKHLELITADVSRADISFSHLKYDLIDHICCDLENEMSHGLPFEKAYEMVKKRIGLRGLQQIQEDTLSLIDKKYRIMKNTMKIFGVISTILMSFGALFKIEHWPGAGVMLVLGFFLLCFVFLPSAVYVSYREVSNRTKLFLHLTGFLAGFLFAIGFLFKIQHWPGAGYLIIIAAAVSLFFIPAFFINQLRQTNSATQKTALVFGLVGSIFHLLGFLFKINHWPGAAIALMAGTILLIFIAFPMYAASHYKGYEHVSSRFAFVTFAVIWFIVPTMLISLNVSKDVREGFKEIEQNKQFNIQYLTSKNNKIFTQLSALNQPEYQKIKEYSLRLKSNSDELVNYVQTLKIKIIALSGVDTIGQNQQINIEALIDTDGDASQQVLFKEGEANKLKEKVEQYRQLLVQDSTVNDNIKKQLINILATDAPDRNTPEFYNTWNRYHLLCFTLIAAINQLSVIQENVRSAEHLALKSLCANAFK